MMLAYFLTKKNYLTAARYSLVVLLLFLGFQETISFGLSHVYVLYYPITLLIGMILISRNIPLVLITILIPPFVDLFFYRNGQPDIIVYLLYIGMTSAFSILAGVYKQTQKKYELERQRILEAEAVRQAGASVVSSLDLQETIEKILVELKNIIPHDSASVLMYREEGCLEVIGGSGWDHPEDVLGVKFPIPGDNPNTIVMQEGRPHILGNAPKEYSSFKGELHGHIRSWLGVPLIYQDRIIGMMAIDSKQENHFSEQNIRVVTAFADHVAIAIENAMLFQVSTQAIKRRLILYQASQDIIRTIADPEEIFKAIHRAASELMPCEAFIISLLDEEKEQIEGVYLIDRGGRNKNIIIPLDKGLTGEIIRTGNPILVEDVFQETSFEGRHFGHKDEIRSLLAVPLKSGGENIGMLSAQSYQVGAYNQEDLEILELLAAQAAIAIKNTQLLTKMEYIARTDSLTGLLNRRAFDERLGDEIKRAQRYQFSISLLMIDVDDFKQYNDAFGHSQGDDHLKFIANLILTSVRQPDLVARIGGEEFCVILPHTMKVGGHELAERIRETVEQAFDGSSDPASTVSIGVAEYPRDANSLSKLYSTADQAMFTAKKTGKNRVVLANVMGEKS
jgi:diguanylate cyclase (GGDEF)-like protein